MIECGLDKVVVFTLSHEASRAGLGACAARADLQDTLMLLEVKGDDV